MGKRLNQLASIDAREHELASETLRAELKAFRDQLDRLLESGGDLRSFWTGTASRRPISASQVRHVLKARAARSRFFGADLFADPAWDMMLDLYAAHLTGGLISVSSLCLVSGVPTSTGLRWIKVLEGRGFVAREDDPHDHRRVYLSLTPRAIGAIESYFATFELPI